MSMSINENPEQKRVMIFGSSPLPFKNAEKNIAQIYNGKPKYSSSRL